MTTDWNLLCFLLSPEDIRLFLEVGGVAFALRCIILDKKENKIRSVSSTARFCFFFCFKVKCLSLKKVVLTEKPTRLTQFL